MHVGVRDVKGNVAASALGAWRAAAFVFLASCATLVLELVAGRVLSPYVGSSLYTWTTIIGVVLAGISLGNWLGGKVADRYPSPRTVGLMFLLGALGSLLILGIVALLGDGRVVRPISLLPRIFLLTTLLFFPPSFVLGMITPVAIRLTLPDVRRTGRVVGLVYALGTLGSLAGNYLTGFVLVAYLPVNTIVLGVAAVLLVLGIVGGEWWRQPKPGSPVSIASERGQPAPADPERFGFEPSRRGRWDLTGNVVLGCGVVVVASFCTMVIELAASRILAPFIGVSLYSWTGIIGVMLAGIALGNFTGGRIADRWPRQWVLGLCLFLAGLFCLSILQAVRVATQPGLFTGLGLMERIVALTAAVFFVPSFALGTISPQVIRLVMADLSHAGRVSGRVYAWSTAGAIAGTFAAGWALISLLGVNRLVLVVSLILIALAIAVGGFWRKAIPLVAAVGIAAGSVYWLEDRGALISPCAMETNYFCIKVHETSYGDVAVKSLVLDHLIHSFVKIGDPSFLGYPHEQVQAELARVAAARTPSPHVLVIGGGGYTFPRWVEAFVPSATMEVVEIDPGVTEISYRELGLPRDTRIVSYALDGRQFVHELAPRKHYQLVVQDAVNDLSVPYHILTKEYNDYVREILTDDGVYLLTVIDLYEDGQLLRSAIRTMAQTFPEVRLLATQPQWKSPGSGVFVIAGSNRRLDLEEMRQVLKTQGVDPMQTMAQPDDELQAYVAKGPQIVLTDQYAPVDNLISILFRSRY